MGAEQMIAQGTAYNNVLQRRYFQHCLAECGMQSKVKQRHLSFQFICFALSRVKAELSRVIHCIAVSRVVVGTFELVLPMHLNAFTVPPLAETTN